MMFELALLLDLDLDLANDESSTSRHDDGVLHENGVNHFRRRGGGKRHSIARRLDASNRPNGMKFWIDLALENKMISNVPDPATLLAP
jgi:hypothetical protein